MDESLIPLGLVNAPRREHMVELLIERNRPATLAQTTCAHSGTCGQTGNALAMSARNLSITMLLLLPLDLDFHHIIALVDLSLCQSDSSYLNSIGARSIIWAQSIQP